MRILSIVLGLVVLVGMLFFPLAALYRKDQIEAELAAELAFKDEARAIASSSKYASHRILLSALWYVQEKPWQADNPAIWRGILSDAQKIGLATADFDPWTLEKEDLSLEKLDSMLTIRLERFGNHAQVAWYLESVARGSLRQRIEEEQKDPDMVWEVYAQVLDIASKSQMF